MLPKPNWRLATGYSLWQHSIIVLEDKRGNCKTSEYISRQVRQVREVSFLELLCGLSGLCVRRTDRFCNWLKRQRTKDRGQRMKAGSREALFSQILCPLSSVVCPGISRSTLQPDPLSFVLCRLSCLSLWHSEIMELSASNFIMT